MKGPGEVDALGTSIAVNGWHGLFHLLTGAAGIAACLRRRTAAAYALVMAVVYLSAAVCSLFTGSIVFGLIRVDEFGSADHAVEAAILLAVWFGSRSDSSRGISEDPLPLRSSSPRIGD